MQHPDDHDDGIPESPSKSQLKREMLELQDLGVELVKLPPAQLTTLELPEKLLDAVELARRISSHGAQKRQRQYIGGLLAKLDDVQPIRDLLERLKGADKVSKARFHENERWRARLISEGDAALTEFLGRHPEVDNTCAGWCAMPPPRPPTVSRRATPGSCSATCKAWHKKSIQPATACG